MSDFMPDITITGEQIRAARSVMRLGQRQFAELCHVSLGVLRRMEKTHGPVSNDVAILKAIQHSLESHGVELIHAGYYEGYGGPGVRMMGEPALEENVIMLEETANESLEIPSTNQEKQIS